MKPKIDATAFGSITVGGETARHDVIIRLDGRVKKRKKKLSKAVYGTSHVISVDEAKFVYEKGAQGIIVGTGQYGAVKLSGEAEEYFEKKKCTVKMIPTPEAIHVWNDAEGSWVGLFHVTC